jgi:hypothetical protein
MKKLINILLDPIKVFVLLIVSSAIPTADIIINNGSNYNDLTFGWIGIVIIAIIFGIYIIKLFMILLKLIKMGYYYYFKTKRK